jgi:excisionase family DNA binding protein
MDTEVPVTQDHPVFVKKLYTMKEVANHFKMSYQSVYKLVRDGKIPSIRLGKRVIRIDADELEKVLFSKGETV